jgi:hypothetical protein
VGALIRSRRAPILLLCAYEHSAWLPELMAYGTFDYRICPILATSCNRPSSRR